jgi:hypothetical protein
MNDGANFDRFNGAIECFIVSLFLKTIISVLAYTATWLLPVLLSKMENGISLIFLDHYTLVLLLLVRITVLVLLW